MILEYLRAESASSRFSAEVKEAMDSLGFDEKIITSPNLASEAENQLRRQLLSRFRGYGENRELFERFPAHLTDWQLCGFSTPDLGHIRYINYSYWNDLSAGTKSPLTAAETIRQGKLIYNLSNDGYIQAAEYIKSGGTFPRPFFLTADGENFVIVEGHFRITAYALVPELFMDVEVITARCPKNELDNWM